MADWEGYEPLRQRIINEVPHFGNADPYADEQMNWVIDTYYNICKECYSTRTRIYKAGLYGAADHVAGIHNLGDTGRQKNRNAYRRCRFSGSGSRHATAPLRCFSLRLCYDHSKFMDGVCLNIRIHPTCAQPGRRDYQAA